MSVAPPPGPLAPGVRLDRYELLWPIAEGGMASVWLARLHGKHGFEKLVAVKTILPKYASDPHFVRMFLDEARIASAIEHTNVARILDLGEENGVLYIAMEWVDGDSLSKLQRVLARAGIALPMGVLLRIMADACAGLHAAHELRGRDGVDAGVVHRDVSPQNILVSAEGVAKVIDFGVAKARDRVSDETSGGALKGKVQYMAPEQGLGRPVDRRADVWAVGAVLYYFFTGRRVYESTSELASLHLLTSGAPPPPLPPTVALPVRHIVEGALQFDPSSRWPTLDVVRRRLEQAMVDLGCFVRTEDVANFVATYAHERAMARRSMVAKALQAADARSTLEREHPSIASASGLIDVQSRANTSLVTASGAPPIVEPRTHARAHGNEASSATIGSAALDTPQPRGRVPLGAWFGGIAALGTLAAGAAGLIYVLRSGSGSNAVVAASATPTSTSTSTSTPTPTPSWTAIPSATGPASPIPPPPPPEAPSPTARPEPAAVHTAPTEAPTRTANGAPSTALAKSAAPPNAKPPVKRAAPKAGESEADDGF